MASPRRGRPPGLLILRNPRLALYRFDQELRLELYALSLVQDALKSRPSTSLSDVLSMRRTLGAVTIRHAVWQRLVDEGYQFKQIARAFACDHTTVMYATGYLGQQQAA